MDDLLRMARSVSFIIGLLQFLIDNYPEILKEYGEQWGKLENA